jgi:hypothetical protein
MTFVKKLACSLEMTNVSNFGIPCFIIFIGQKPLRAYKKCACIANLEIALVDA